MNTPVKAGIDGIVWLVIIVIAVVSELRKAAARMGRPPGKPGEGTWGLPAPDAKDTPSLDRRIAEYLERRQSVAQERTAPKTARRTQPPPPPPRPGAQPAAARVPPRRRPGPLARVTPPMPPRRAPATRNVPPVPVSPAAVRPPVVAASKPAAAPMPPREAMPHEATPIAAVRAALRADLRQTRSLQHAFLLSEILGPPRALRAIRCGGVACPVSPGTARPRLARSTETGILNSKTRRKP